MHSLADIQPLVHRRGAERYSGEPVTRLEHALRHSAAAQAQGDDGAKNALATPSLSSHVLQRAARWTLL